MRWADPWAIWGLFGLIVVVIAMFWSRRHAAQMKQNLADAHLQSALLQEQSRSARIWKTTLLLLAAVALFGSSLRPQWGARTELARQRGLDIIFALDVSRSMLTRDVAPDRLRRAKLEIAAMTDSLAGNRMALVAFAGSAFVQCPLTTDSSAVKMFLDVLRPDVVPQGGTAIARALSVSARLFASSQSKAGDDGHQPAQVLVLITDGEDHEGQVKQAAAKLKEQGVHVFVVGIGSKQGQPIPEVDEQGQVTGYLKDRQGQVVLSHLDEQGLRSISEASGGELFAGPRVDQSLLQVGREIGKLTKAEFAQRLSVQYSERYQWPLALGLLFLFVALLIPQRRRGGQG